MRVTQVQINKEEMKLAQDWEEWQWLQFVARILRKHYFHGVEVVI